MEMEELEIIIPKDGTVQVRTRGFRGDRCLAATKSIEEATGTITERTLKADYFIQEEQRSVRQTFNGRSD